MGLINQLAKYSSEYAMITTKIRTLLHKGIKFIWTPQHQEEFDKVIESLSNLDKLEPCDPKKDLYALFYARVCGLSFILFQKESKGRSRI